MEKEEKIKFEVKLHETKVKLQDKHILKNTSQTSKTMIGIGITKASDFEI